jgi:hypothetical protein
VRAHPAISPQNDAFAKTHYGMDTDCSSAMQLTAIYNWGFDMALAIAGVATVSCGKCSWKSESPMLRHTHSHTGGLFPLKHSMDFPVSTFLTATA